MKPLAVVIAIVLVDLIGFSLVMPLLPRFAGDYGFSPSQIGLLLAAFPACQLVAGPILGRLSDRYGRRPVLIVSQFGTALSFVILGLSRDFTIMLLARALDGASGGNILVAQAYVADVTKPEDRAKGLGLIGAAFGIGFTLGPLLGGLLLELPVAEAWRLRVPFLVAAGFSTIAWLLVLFRLPESRPVAEARVLSWRGLVDVVTTPAVGLLVLVGGLATLAFAALEGTFSLYLRGRMGWGAGRAAFAFALFGLVTATVQGGFIRRLVPRFGEPRLILAGLAALAVGLAGIGGATAWPALLAALAVAAVGQGLYAPTVSGLLSRVTPASEQGAVFGTFVSAATLARMINYYVSNRLLGAWGPSAPFFEGAALAALALVVAAFAVMVVIGPKAWAPSERSAGPELDAAAAAPPG